MTSRGTDRERWMRQVGDLVIELHLGAPEGSHLKLRSLNAAEAGDPPVLVVNLEEVRRLATGSWNNTARLWRLRLDELLGLACRVAGRNLIHAEWQQCLGDEPYRPTCPSLPVPEE